MGDKFSGSEIVDMAIQIEKNGRDFYKKIAESLKGKEIKKIFEYLAKQETKHIKVFEDMLLKVKRYERPKTYTDEYFGYIKALSEEYIFTKKEKGKEAAKSVSSPRRAVELGLNFERDSILFYYEMKNFVPEPDKDIIDSLMKEEQTHLKKLSLLRRRCYA